MRARARRAAAIGVALIAWGLLASVVLAQSAALLPNGKQQFLDANGAPLAAGSVGMYIPTTLTPKLTWIDPAEVTPNTNPVLLDSSGEALIYGAGQYRQILKDVNGNTIWDQLTFGQGPQPIWGGTSGGTGNAPTLTAGAFSATAGQQLAWRVGATNSGAVVLTVNGAPYAVDKDTISGPVALTGGELTLGNVAIATYDSVLGLFHLVGNNAATGIGTQQNLAGAGTTDLGSISSNNVNVTGSGWTINSLGASASINSPLFLVNFASTGTITQSSSLLLPGNQSIAVTAGSFAWALYLGSGNWEVLQYSARGGPPFPVYGQARLVDTSTSVVTLKGFNGNAVTFPSGQVALIPSAGVASTVSNAVLNGTAAQTLASNTLYYAYLWNSGTLAAPTWVINWSQTGHATDPSGIEIKSGDATQVLVGMVQVSGSGFFLDAAASRQVASWFNRQPKQLYGAFTANRSTTSSSLTEINSEIRVNFVDWGDDVQLAYAGALSDATSTQYNVVSLDGATATPGIVGTNTNTGAGSWNGSISGNFVPTEGFHYATVLGATAGGSTGQWFWSTAGQLGGGILNGGLSN